MQQVSQETQSAMNRLFELAGIEPTMNNRINVINRFDHREDLIRRAANAFNHLVGQVRLANPVWEENSSINSQPFHPSHN